MKTQWMSMLDLLKRIIIEYKPLFTIMQADQNPYKWQKVNETPHVQIVFYNFQFSETYKLTKLKSIRFQRIENQIKI